MNIFICVFMIAVLIYNMSNILNVFEFKVLDITILLLTVFCIIAWCIVAVSELGRVI